MHLQNVVMQLRKVCSHPFLFDWPLDQRTCQPVVDEQLVDASGKMMVLERLLDALFARGHKVLVFSQFVTMLDVIEVSRSWLPLVLRHLLIGDNATAGLGARVQALATVPHRRFDRPVGTPRGDESLPRGRQRARRATPLPSEHACWWAGHQPHRCRHRRVLRSGLGA